jgi:hypothetical protein
MVIQLQSLPQTGRLEIDIKVTADVNVSAYSARQKVNSFILSEISYMMHAGEPNLAIGEMICWRVPVVLSLASYGDIGEVGAIDVNAETGQMYTTPQLITEVSARAEGLAAHLASEAAG